MLSAKCPGQDRRNWKPEDIFEHDCPHCGNPIEFWKTDAKRTCPECHEQVLNPKFNLGCALWCAYAEQCVGDISSIFTQRPEALRDRLEIEVGRHFLEEKERFNFTLDASQLASRLLELEKEADPPVVVSSVLLHEVGYPVCKKEIGDNGKLEHCIPSKSKEIADKIMKDLTLPRQVREKTLAIISCSDEEKLAGDINYRLWQDILKLTRFKLKMDQGKVSGEDKEELIRNLKTESARKFAAKSLIPQ